MKDLSDPIVWPFTYADDVVKALRMTALENRNGLREDHNVADALESVAEKLETFRIRRFKKAYPTAARADDAS